MSSAWPLSGRTSVWSWCSILLLAFTASPSLLAQNTASISGVVKDQTAAVLPGAKVTVLNVDTGSARSVVTSASGTFRVVALPVGTYQVEAEMPGFQTASRRGISLTLGRDAVVELTLQVGDVAEQVTVTAEAPLVDTATATLGGMIDSNQMREIPLNARSFLELVPLQANAVMADTGQQNASKGFGAKLSIGGTRYNTNSFLLDGADVNDSLNVAGSAAGTMAGVETVREFRVIVNAYDAEYGRHSGGVVSAVTKSGTNEIHGSVFEFLRNDNLDAPRWQDNAFGGGEKPEFRRNQFGFSLGGPVRENRMFFFASYEGLRDASGQTATYNVPGFLVRSGIVPTSSGARNNIGIHAVTRPYLLAYPEPNLLCDTGCAGSDFPFDRNNGAARHVRGETQTTNQNYWTGRLDHRISDSDSLFVRVTVDGAEQEDPGFVTFAQSKTANRFSTLEETHIFSPSLLARTHFSYNRTHIREFDIVNEGFQYPNDFWSFDRTDVPGHLSVSNLTGWGGSSTNPKRHIQNVFQTKEDLFWSRGRHAFKFGGQFERFQFNNRGDFNSGGVFNFNSITAFLQNVVNTANFVAPGSDNDRGLRQNLLGLYFQDDFKWTPQLTLNLGIRYEIISVPKEVHGEVANIWDITPAHVAVVTPQTTDVGDPYFENPSLKNFSPRMGLAWDPFGSGKTSVRTGFGLFDNQVLSDLYRSPIVRAAPFYSVVDLSANNLVIAFPDAYFSQRSQLLTAGGRPQIDGMEHFFGRSYVMKWSFEVQQQIGGSTTIETGYAASRALRLMRGSTQLNPTPACGGRLPACPAGVNNPANKLYFLIDQNQPSQAFDRMRWRLMDGTSDYHAFKLNLTRRFSRSLQFQSSWTFSRSTDDSSTWNGPDYDNDRAGYGILKDHGLSSYDVRNSFYTNFVYDLPGSQITGAAGKLFGGWSVSGILRLNSGNPTDVTGGRRTKGNRSLRHVSGASMDLVPGGDNNPTSGTTAGCSIAAAGGSLTIPAGQKLGGPDLYFDPCQFTWPGDDFVSNPSGIYAGNLGRHHLIGPGVANVDFTLSKGTALPWIGEAGMLQFRSEFFNLFNHPNFNGPATSLFDNQGRPAATPGRISSAKAARQIQFAVKVIF